jgi:hypothetical protein
MAITDEQREQIITVEPGSDLARVLNRANAAPLRVEVGGARYRIERERDGLIPPPNPRGLREALRRSAGAFARIGHRGTQARSA